MAHTTTHPGTARTRDEKDIETHRRERSLIDTDLQQEQYGGMHWGAALYGWLVSTGIGAILTAIVAAAGGAIALNAASTANTDTKTIGIAGGIALLVILAIAYYAGGYVAGRLARFDGARQGIATWLVGLIIALALGGLGAAAGAKYNVLQQINLPHLPVGANLTKGGLIATVVALIVTLVAAILGGKTGEHYHAKIDAGGTVGTLTD